MFIINKNKVAEAKKIINSSKKILVTGHTHPDGDAVGGSLAVYHYFKKLNFDVTIVMPDAIPSSVAWLPMANEILFHDENKDRVGELVADADVIFCVDFNEPKRLKSLKVPIEEAKATKIMIDHHPQPDDFVDITFSDTKISSASEYVYYFLKEFDESNLDKTIAECLFLGIVTDTGSFVYSSATPSTFTAASELLSYGIDKQKILSNTLDNYSENRTRLMGYILHNKMVVLSEHKTAYITITKEEFDKFGYENGDHENFVNIPLSIKGIEISALFMEIDDSIRLSFRSSGSFDVNLLARNHFNGGGHQKAAGGKTYKTLSETVDRFVEIIKSQIK